MQSLLLFAPISGIPSTSSINCIAIPVLYYRLVYHPTSSTMSTLPMARAGSSLGGDPLQYDISNTRNDHGLTNNIHGHLNSNVGNVSNSFNNYYTFNVGVYEESLRVQAWLSPLKPNKRHQYFSERRMDGIGDWVLERNDFETWCRNQDGSGDPTLFCYGVQGVGKTFIRYHILWHPRVMLIGGEISSLVIDSLRQQSCGRNIVVLSLYCDYQAQKDQSAVNMIGSLLSQVALGARHISSEMQHALRRVRGVAMLFDCRTCWNYSAKQSIHLNGYTFASMRWTSYSQKIDRNYCAHYGR